MTTGEIVMLASAVMLALVIAGGLGILAASWAVGKVLRYRQRMELTHLREAKQWWGKR